MHRIVRRAHQFLRYGFARSIAPPEPELTIDGEINVPTPVYNSLLMIPTQLPIFPHNSMVTRIHPLLSELIEKHKIKHIGAFAIQEDREIPNASISQFNEAFQIEEPATPQEAEQKALLITKPLNEQISALLDNFHQNIIYDTESEPQLKFITKLDDVYPIGTVCKVSFQKYDERGNLQNYLILKGLQRVQLIQRASFQNNSSAKNKILSFVTATEEKPESELITHVKVQPIRDPSQQFVNDTTYQVKLSQLLGIYARLRQKIPINVPDLVRNPSDPSTIDVLCGFLCLTTYFDQTSLIKLFMTLSIHDRLNLCLQYFEKYSKELHSQWELIETKTNLPVDNQTQKQKMKEIYDFLKQQFANPSTGPFVQKIVKQMEGREFPEHIQILLQDELSQLSELSEHHPDFNTKKNFIELLVSLPFGIRTADDFSLNQAKEVLDKSHYGLEQVKARVLEFLAVSKLRKSPSGKTLLLSGPPGVGKTSIASTIAECLGRKFVRVSLGGESDVAIIKGHRKTYMASYPGKIIQALKQAQTENPVILLDEIDKLGRSYRGSISDALLEVLDPVQNSNFIDNYLEVGVDLSKVLFICSANLLDTIPQPLYDRMELIELSGYTLDEKIHITENHLIPKIVKDSGLAPYLTEQKLDKELISYIIDHYCRESGVRSLQRTLQRLYEKLVMKVVRNQQTGSEANLNVTVDQLEDLIGLPPFDENYLREPTPGLGVGLAYNSYGGSLMYIEIVRTSFEQKDQVGGLKITGQLGNTIKESVQIAYSHAKAILHQQYNNHFLEESQLHMHFPAGAVKKDGPSAGIAIASALISIAIQKPIKSKTAMTGEISLTGKVLRIGGLKEKVLAAKREGIQDIIIPEGNRGDLEELAPALKEGITFHCVEEFSEVVKILF